MAYTHRPRRLGQVASSFCSPRFSRLVKTTGMMAVGPHALEACQIAHHLNSAEVAMIEVLPQLLLCAAACARLKVGGVELSTSSRFTEVKSPTMEFDCGCSGRRLNKVRLSVKRGFLLQMASTSA